MVFSIRIVAGLIACSIVAGFSGVTYAQERLTENAVSPDQTETRAGRATARKNAGEELQQIKESIAISTERANELRKEIEALSGNQTELSAALIASGQRVQLAEIQVNSSEDELAELLLDEAEIRARLDGKQTQIAALLAALQRIGKYPPPALIVNPDDALMSARSAMLLSAVLPEMREEVSLVLTDLKQLDQVKSKAVAERDALSDGLEKLLEERLRVATLLSARKAGISRSSEALAAEEALASTLAGQAGSLNELIASLEREIDTVSQAADAARQAALSTEDAPELSEAEKKIALASLGRTQPAIPFTQTHGIMQLPVNGDLLLAYGDDDGFGGTSKGLSIAARGDAQVIAPSDGWVVYKGPYLNYGQIIILNVGEDYHILLAGLSEVSIDFGQFILLGEPIGRMASQNRANNNSDDVGNLTPNLYIEFRKSGKPVNSATWWADSSISQTDKDRG